MGCLTSIPASIHVAILHHAISTTSSKPISMSIPSSISKIYSLLILLLLGSVKLVERVLVK
jgi:hypothetical protein